MLAAQRETRLQPEQNNKDRCQQQTSPIIDEREFGHCLRECEKMRLTGYDDAATMFKVVESLALALAGSCNAAIISSAADRRQNLSN